MRRQTSSHRHQGKSRRCRSTFTRWLAPISKPKIPEQAESATASLIEKDGSFYLGLIEVARLYVRTDKIEEAIRVVAGIAEQMLAEREEIQLLEVVDELLTSDSEIMFRPFVYWMRAHWWQRDMENLKAALERLAEAAQAAGLERTSAMR